MYDDEWADKWIDRADRCFKDGDYNRSIRIYSYVLRRMATNIRALTGRGDAWMEKKKYVQAYTDYEKAFNLNPSDKEIAHKRRFAFALQFSEEEDKVLKKHLEEERKIIIERFKKERREELKKELRTAIKQITIDPEELRKEAKRNERQSEFFRYCAISTVFLIFVWTLSVFINPTYFHILDIYSPFLRLPIAVAPSFPLMILVWLFLRWRYEAKILSYAFQRKAILEDRINVYFHSEPDRFQEMRKIYITHWIDKSPVELMLDIGTKNKKDGSGSGSDIPAEAVLDKLAELTKPSKFGKDN